MSLPPQPMAGVDVHGLDLDSVPDVTVYDDGTVETPLLRLVGTINLWTLTLTEPATLATGDPALSESTLWQPDRSLWRTACADPGDAPATAGQRQDAIEYAKAQPDVGHVWRSEDARVLNVSFTGDLERHRREMRERYPGPLCVVQAAVSMADLSELQRSVHADREVLEAEGIVVLGTQIPKDRLVIETVAAGPEEVEFLRERYGPPVHVTSWLQPLDD